jgi:GTP-binding protein HflX
MKVLGDLEADTKQMLVVFNKIDKVADDAYALPALRRHFPDAVFVSVHTGEGMNELVERISEFVARGTMTVDLMLPAARTDLVARLHRDGTVHNVKYEAEFTRVSATIPTRALETFAPFLPLPSQDTDAAVHASTE